MTFACLARQAFDSEAFGVDFFRVTRLDLPVLARELETLRRLPRVMADARIPASDRKADLFFQGQGFRKVCVQLQYAAPVLPAMAEGPDPDDTVDNRLPAEAVARHVDNLVYDRFNLDAAVPQAGRDRFQAAWIANSLASCDIRKVYSGESFVSFKVREATAVVDIVSVLTPGQGVGSALMGRVFTAAARLGLTLVVVTTEAENEPACRMYQKNGFLPQAHFSRFHYVSLGDLPEKRRL